LKHIAEAKRIKQEDQQTKMKNKNETEQMIEKAMSKYNRKDPKFVSKSPKRE
jgi:hypothetical protein